MIAYFLVLCVLPAFLIAAAACDITSYTIPNILLLGLLSCFIVFGIAVPLSLSAAASHLFAGLIGFAIGLALFAPGFIGGGDAKLFAVLALWIGLHDFIAYTLTVAILGGVLTLIILILRQFPLPGFLLGQPFILRLHDSNTGIPYGVALAGGVAVMLPHSDIFRLATGA